MDDCVWVVSFDSAGMIKNVFATSAEYADHYAKYYRRYYKSVKVMNEKQLSVAIENDIENRKAVVY